jgi:hypothetical protein
MRAAKSPLSKGYEVLVSFFIIMAKNTYENNLKGGKIYFSSWFQR